MKRLLCIFGGLAVLAWAGLGRMGHADVMPDPPQLMPIIELTKRCPGLRYLGREATFEIVVNNRGNGPAKNVQVTDTLPTEAEFISADNGGQRQGNTINWTIPLLEPGKPRMLSVTMRCTTAGTLRNTARASYCVVAEAACEMQVRGIPALLLECVDEPDPVELGSETTYTIIVTNQGSLTGTNIVIECTLPPEEEFIKVSGVARASANGKTIRFDPLPSLPPRTRARFKVTVKGVKAGDVRFTAVMTGDQLATPVTETESTHIYD